MYSYIKACLTIMVYFWTNKIIKVSLLALIVIILSILVTVPITQPKIQRYTITVISNNSLTFKNTADRNRYQKYVRNGSTGLKYILQWTPSTDYPFKSLKKGQQAFVDAKCPYTNCFVTTDRQYLGDITKFDVITFGGSQVRHMKQNSLPNQRSPHQKYAFVSMEPSYNYPVCSNRFDNIFNMTWTFRLDSEVNWGYILIRDKKLKVVGPKKEMHWIMFKDMDPVSAELKKQLKTKTKAAAWFVSKCHTWSKREEFVKELQKQLKKYALTVDVYGACGALKCARNNKTCFTLIKKKYYFYLSFENSFNKDYVTEKLLTAVQNNAVPIVYGAANYSRFLPDKSYLNARVLGAKALAKKMNQLIKNPVEYYEYFRWKKYYSYSSRQGYVNCQLCSLLNNVTFVKNRKVYKNFRNWWDPPNVCYNNNKKNNEIEAKDKLKSKHKNLIITKNKVKDTRKHKTKKKYKLKYRDKNKKRNNIEYNRNKNTGKNKNKDRNKNNNKNRNKQRKKY